MTILLEPAVEARLREWAAWEKQDADALANALLAEALLRNEADKVEAFRQGLLASGLVKQLAPPRDPSTADRPLIEVPGSRCPRHSLRNAAEAAEEPCNELHGYWAKPLRSTASRDLEPLGSVFLNPAKRVFCGVLAL